MIDYNEMFFQPAMVRYSHSKNHEDFPQLVQLPKNIQLSPQVLQSFQPASDQVIFKSGIYLQRLIFYKEGEQWEDVERQHLQGFQKYLTANNMKIPDNFPTQELLRTLHGSNWNYKQTQLDCNAIHDWHNKVMPVKLQLQDEQILLSGYVTIFGRDKFHRPILMLRPMIPINFTVEPHHLLRAMSFLLFYTKENMFAAGKVENWVLLCDLQHAQPWSLPINALKPFSDTISLQFRCHAAKVFVLNAAKTFLWTWTTVKLMLQEIQIRKVTIVGENTCSELEELVSKENRLKIYGGNQDSPRAWWPPNVPKLISDGPDELLSDFSDIEEINAVESIMLESPLQRRISLISEINEQNSAQKSQVKFEDSPRLQYKESKKFSLKPQAVTAEQEQFSISKCDSLVCLQDCTVHKNKRSMIEQKQEPISSPKTLRNANSEQPKPPTSDKKPKVKAHGCFCFKK